MKSVEVAARNATDLIQFVSPILMTEFLVVIVVLLATVFLQDAVLKRIKSVKSGLDLSASEGEPSSKIPGPWGNLPLIGYLPWLGRRPYVTMWRLAQRYGPVYQIQMGGLRVVVLNGAQTIREAFVQRGDDFSGRPDFPSFRAFCRGCSMAFQNHSDAWTLHAKLGSRALGAFVNNRKFPIDDLVRRHATELCGRLCDASGGGKPVDPFNLIEHSVIEILFRVCYGEQVADDDAVYGEMKEMLHGFRSVMAANQSADIMPWTARLVRPQLDRYRRCLERFDDMSIAKQDELTSGSGYVHGQADCMTRALEDAWREADGVEKSDEAAALNTATKPDRRQLMAIVQDLIGAGTDTVVHLLHWMIQYMAKFPDVQERVRTEVLNVVGPDGTVTGSDRYRMPYAEATVWEAMRHSCVAAIALPHAATCDTVVGGFQIPAGTVVFANIYSTGWDPAVWTDPDEFRPERFMTLSGDAVDRDVVQRFVGFGVGRRRCFGKQLARLELFIYLAVLVQKCSFHEAAGCPLTLDGQYFLTNRAKEYFVDVRAVN